MSGNKITFLLNTMAVLLSTTLATSGCGTNLRISTKGLDSRLRWARENHDGPAKDFTFSKKVFTTLGFVKRREVSIAGLLEEEGIDFKSVDSISFSTGYLGSDFFWNLVPIYAQKTITVSGNYVKRKEFFMEEDLIHDE